MPTISPVLLRNAKTRYTSEINNTDELREALGIPADADVKLTVDQDGKGGFRLDFAWRIAAAPTPEPTKPAKSSKTTKGEPEAQSKQTSVASGADDFSDLP